MTKFGMAALLALFLTAYPVMTQPAPSMGLDEMVSLAERTHGFRGAAIFAAPGISTWSTYTGRVSCKDGREIGPSDRFDMGSITKAFTAAAILRLVERGRLSRTDRLGALLPGVPSDKAGITVQQLLVHQSGLRESSGDDEIYISKDRMLRQEFTHALLFAPGSKTEYSNIGFSVLAAIIEARTGETYERALRKLVLIPAQVPDIGYIHRPLSGQDVDGCRGHEKYGSVRDYFAATEPSWHLVGNGALLVTPRDLLRFFDGVWGGSLLNREHTAFFREQLTRKDASGRLVMRISGSNEIFSSIYFHWPEHRASFLLMTANSSAPREVILPYILPKLEKWLVARGAR